MSKDYIISTTARSGSNLLCSYLRNAHLYGRPAEYFNPDIVIQSSFGTYSATDRTVDFDRYLRKLMKEKRGENGVFGCKVLYEDMIRLVHFKPFADLLSSSTLVMLSRRGKIDQAVSYFLAEQTGQWVSSDTARVRPENVPFDYDRIKVLVSRLIDQDERWLLYLDGLGFDYQTFYYEDVADNPRPVFDYLSQQLMLPQTSIIKAGFRKQSAAISTEFRHRFIERWRNENASLAQKQPYKGITFLSTTSGPHD